MTVNKNGGNRAKKQGRKYAVSGGQDQIVTKTRFAKDKDEIYAAVIKEFGNGRALVKCIDSVERLLHIRKKFKGRSKGQNYIKSGVWVLVGLRSWETSKKEGIKENCDLLEVYYPQDVKWLKKMKTNHGLLLKLLDGLKLMAQMAMKVMVLNLVVMNLVF